MTTTGDGLYLMIAQNDEYIDQDYDLEVKQEQESFFALLPRVFFYPLKHGGLIALIAGVVFYVVIRFLSFISFVGYALLLLALIYLCGFLVKVVSSSASGKDALPDWPDISQLGDEVVRPCLFWVGTSIFCFAPAFAYLYFARPPDADSDLIYWLLFVLGSAYFPMALLAVILFENPLALNPITVVRAIARVPLEYVTALGILLVLSLMNWLFELLLVQVPVAGFALQALTSLYLAVIEMRVLGLIYWCNRERLSWFEGH